MRQGNIDGCSWFLPRAGRSDSAEATHLASKSLFLWTCALTLLQKCTPVQNSFSGCEESAARPILCNKYASCTAGHSFKIWWGVFFFTCLLDLPAAKIYSTCQEDGSTPHTACFFLLVTSGNKWISGYPSHGSWLFVHNSTPIAVAWTIMWQGCTCEYMLLPSV